MLLARFVSSYGGAYRASSIGHRQLVFARRVVQSQFCMQESSIALVGSGLAIGGQHQATLVTSVNLVGFDRRRERNPPKWNRGIGSAGSVVVNGNLAMLLLPSAVALHSMLSSLADPAPSEVSSAGPHKRRYGSRIYQNSFRRSDMCSFRGRMGKTGICRLACSAKGGGQAPRYIEYTYIHRS